MRRWKSQCSFGSGRVIFVLALFPTSAWINAHEFTNPVYYVFMWWCSVFTIPIIHEPNKVPLIKCCFNETMLCAVLCTVFCENWC